MKLHSPETAQVHRELYLDYKRRLDDLDDEDQEGEVEAPFERSFLHNAIQLHALWFEQLEGGDRESKASYFEEILNERDSDRQTFEKWMSGFAREAHPNGWAVWGWSYIQKTFVGFPMLGHSDGVPVGILPLLVIDCWEHSYLRDFGTDFDMYLTQFWSQINWKVIDARHLELAEQVGFKIK